MTPTENGYFSQPLLQEKCLWRKSQSGPVWFLAGTFGGKAERTCTIPSGKAILFPPINTECSYKENPMLKTESDLRACAKHLQDETTQMQAVSFYLSVTFYSNYKYDQCNKVVQSTPILIDIELSANTV